MNYIINPSWFYWLSVASAIKITMFCIAGVLAVVVTIFMAEYFANVEYGEKDKDFVRAKRMLKLFVPIMVAALIAGIFIPSRQTLIEMMVAKFATYENAEWTVDAIKSAVDYIVQAIKSIG